ncbi:MAG: hypothetical protein U0R17_01635 [Acidimicrobiia bacterium]
MVVYQRPPFRMRSGRGVSYPMAVLTKPDGTKVRVEATDFNEANRPEKDSLVCPACGQSVNWVVGQLKRNQPETLDSKPVRGKPFFAHRSGTLDFHLEKESDLIARDLTQYLIGYGNKRGWNPTAFSRSPRHCGIVDFNIDSGDGKTKTIHLVVSPRPVHSSIPYDDAIVITSTTGQMGDRRRLVLHDKQGNPLSGARLTDYLTSGKANKIMVSGYYGSQRSPRNESERLFRPKRRELNEVLDEIASGQIVWVEGVDAIAYEKFPAGEHFALVDASDVAFVQSLLLHARPKIEKKQLSAELAEKTGLSLYSDSSTKGNGGRYTFGKADVLYVYPGDVDNGRWPWREGGKKVIINPHVARITTSMTEQDWRDSLVLFVGDNKNWQAFRQKADILRHKFGDDVITVRNVNNPKFAVRAIEEFMGPEKQEVKSIVDRANWDLDRNFLDWETGMQEPVVALTERTLF